MAVFTMHNRFLSIRAIKTNLLLLYTRGNLSSAKQVRFSISKSNIKYVISLFCYKTFVLQTCLVIIWLAHILTSQHPTPTWRSKTLINILFYCLHVINWANLGELNYLELHFCYTLFYQQFLKFENFSRASLVWHLVKTIAKLNSTHLIIL